MTALLPGTVMAACPPVPPEIATPLGALTFATEINGCELPATPLRAFRLPSGAVVSRWSTSSADVETGLGRYVEEPIGPVELTDCWALLWRVSARVALPGVVVTATLPVGAQGVANPGQGIAAVEFDADDVRLSVGTRDEEDLCAGPGAPPRWESLLPQVYKRRHWPHWGVNVFENRGLRWQLPELAAGEQCDLSFAASWRTVTPKDADDQSTWFAVGMPVDMTLCQADSAGLR
ncbi:hypothetical protein ABZW30_38890 [Kitasatospora sp. NPDC004669]|uniref:hypothetical protein n=1 Tax=Kitasatospora sp. NPDC004669 TaxID=3154555 RepID=UPI0033B5FDEA